MPYDRTGLRTVSRDRLERLSSRAMALPRIAIAGEFSSGKSTLLNLLLRQEIMPMQATATALPAVWISHGTDEPYYVDANGRRRALPSGDIAQVPPDGLYIRLFLQAECLESCDLIDLSGLSDPGRSDAQTQKMLRMANMVIWCTPATQAWRQSERANWLSMPPRLRAHSLVAVTRADKIDSKQDLERVVRRVRRETETLFAETLAISGTLALEALTTQDVEAWDASGIDLLQEAMAEQIDAFRQSRQRLLDRYVPEPTADPEESGPDYAAKLDGAYQSAAADDLGDETDALRASVANLFADNFADDDLQDDAEGIEQIDDLSEDLTPDVSFIAAPDIAPLILRNKLQPVEDAADTAATALAGAEENAEDTIRIDALDRLIREQDEPAEQLATTALSEREAEVSHPKLGLRDLGVTNGGGHQSHAALTISEFEQSMHRVLASYFPRPATPEANATEREAQDHCDDTVLWRRIVAQNSLSEENMQIAAMIEQFLTARAHGLSQQKG